MTFLLRTYEVAVRGHSAGTYLAISRSKAKAQVFRVFHEVWGCSFREFIARVERVRLLSFADAGLQPRRVTVLGKPAYEVSRNSQYVQIVYSGGDVVLNAHPSDVSEVSHG